MLYKLFQLICRIKDVLLNIKIKEDSEIGFISLFVGVFLILWIIISVARPISSDDFLEQYNIDVETADYVDDLNYEHYWKCEDGQGYWKIQVRIYSEEFTLGYYTKNHKRLYNTGIDKPYEYYLTMPDNDWNLVEYFLDFLKLDEKQRLKYNIKDEIKDEKEN